MLGYLAAFTGWEADRALFELLCEPDLPPEVLYRLLDILKGRTLSETGPIAEVGPVLERVVQRLPGLLTEGDLPRRVRSDTLLFAARLPTPLASPFLAKVLLGKEGLGERIEDRLAAAAALQDLLVRQRKAPGLVETVGATLQEGLQLRDTQGLSLARVRAACAEKLGNDPFSDPSQSLPIMESLGLALVIEKAPEALEAIVTAMRKLGQKVLKEPAPKALQKARFFLLQRLENQSGKAESPAEGDLLFPAVVELCGTDRASRIAAGRAFAAMGHREHALSLFESLALVPEGGGSGQAPMESVDLAKLLRDHLSTLLTGRLPGEGPLDPVLSGLGEAELLLGHKLLARLRELREAGVGLSWGRREQEWSLAVALGLAQVRRDSGESGAEFFGEAADVLQEILTTQSLPPLERLSRRVLRAQALIGSAPVRPKALAEAVAALQQLVQEEPTHVQAQRLLAGALEGQGAWAAAADQWRSLAGLFTRASPEEWSALLKALAAQIQAGQASQARGFLEVLHSHPLPPEGEERAGIQQELARLAALLKSES